MNMLLAILMARKKAVIGGGTALSGWSATDKHSSVTVGGTGLIQGKDSDSGSWRAGRGEVGLSAGKIYWEVLYNEDGGVKKSSVGVMTASAALTSYVGADAHGYGWVNETNGGPQFRNNDADVGSHDPHTAADGDRMMFAFDITNGHIWVGLNGTWKNSGDPATDTNPIYSGIPAGTYYMAGSQRDTDETFTLPAEDTDLVYTVPAGFQAGWY